MKRFLLCLIALASTPGCAGTEVAPGARVQQQRSAQLQAIAVGCGLPAEALRLEGEDQLHVNLPPDAPYRAVDCMLTRVRQLGYPLNMGFVGNEAPAPENR